jgi:hypothetical protein
MPFEPLNTDERIEQSAPRERSMDDQMLFGCSGFVIASIGGYALSVWPFFLFADIEKVSTLAKDCAIGFVPAVILGLLVSRRFGLPGACGAVGGAIASAMFLYLRIEQAFMAHLARQAPEPDYPSILQGLVPLAWLLAVILVALAAMPKEKD